MNKRPKTGWHHTEETKEKIRKKTLGVPRPQGWKRTNSPETREKMRLIHLGKRRTLYIRKICEYCGQYFEFRISRLRTNPKYCSKYCYSRFMKPFFKRRFGETNNLWKGGRTGEHITKDGHKTVYDQKLIHNGYGWKYKHRLIMENFLGRELTSEEIIHHIDENPQNDNISNLAIVSRAEHMTIHKSKELWPLRN